MPHYKEPDREAVLAFMQTHPFAVLMGVDAAGKPVATQVPLLVRQRQEQLYLVGHIQRKTDHHKAFEQNNQVLALFTGPHAYVSASWYTDVSMASTWNYMTVQAKGLLRFLDDADLYDLLKETTERFENNPAFASLVEHLSDDYVRTHMKAIVAFEVDVQELNHVFKLSQNRDEASYDNIIHQLQQQGGEAAAVARVMQERKHKVFSK